MHLNPASLSLRDEARNTERHSLWSSNVQLRHTQVNFVRAEELDANTLTENRDEGRKNGNSMKRAASGPSTRPNTTYRSIEMNGEECKLEDSGKGGQADIEGLFSGLDMPLESSSPLVSRERVFLIDTVGSGKTNTGMHPPVLRSSSPSSSSSSDEVIIFMGRSRTQGRRPSKATSGVASATCLDPLENVFAGSRIIEDRVTMLSPLKSDTVRVSALSVRSSEENVTLSQPVAAERRVEQTHKNGKRKKRSKKPTDVIGQKNAIEAEDASLADYIANMSDDAQQDSSIASTPIYRQGLSATGTGKGRRKTEPSSSEPRAQHSSALESRWNISDIEDLEDLSTSDEVLGSIKAIISKRERPSGLQYLVVCEEYTVDDARWIPHTSLESESAVKSIRLYEAEEQLQSHYSADDSDTSLLSDGERAQESDTDDELEALRDEEDLLQRRNERLTDEKIARLLAKQEELGLGSNEVMLFDDDFVNDITSSDHTKAEHVSSTRKKLGSVNHQKRGKRSMGGAFQQASALANLLDQDHYSGFDIMDHDRPSLKTRLMGRQGAQPFDVSDTDLELSLSSAWHKDRLKKQAKKHEREELRAQGLLGKKNRKKPDLHAKYLEGMTMDQIKDEITGFISSTNERYLRFVCCCMSELTIQACLFRLWTRETVKRCMTSPTLLV